VPERKLGNFFKSKEGGNYNRRNTFKYFEDYNLRLTQILGKLTVFVQALVKTQANNQAYADPNPDKNPEDDQSNRYVVPLQFLGRIKMGKFVKKFITKVHKKECQDPSHKRIDEICYHGIQLHRLSLQF
jgi:hypothetical protein